MDYFLPVSPNTQRKLPGCHFWFTADRLYPLTTVDRSTDHYRFRLMLLEVIHFSSPITIRFKNGSILLRSSRESQMEIRSEQLVNHLMSYSFYDQAKLTADFLGCFDAPTTHLARTLHHLTAIFFRLCKFRLMIKGFNIKALNSCTKPK